MHIHVHRRHQAKLEQEKLDWRVKRDRQRQQRRRTNERMSAKCGGCGGRSISMSSGAGESAKQRTRRLNAEQRASKRLRVEMDCDEGDTLHLVPQEDRLYWSLEYDHDHDPGHDHVYDHDHDYGHGRSANENKAQVQTRAAQVQQQQSSADESHG